MSKRRSGLHNDRRAYRYDCCPPKINCSLLTSGNALANMDTTGLTDLKVLDGTDDFDSIFPVNFDFYFFGTNYGNGLNQGIFWDSNSVLGFGQGASQNPWSSTTGLGILTGNAD